MKHNMKLNNEPFLQMKYGMKKIEMRLYDEKRRKIKKGDMIEFCNVETGETLKRTVTEIHLFPNFQELYEAFDKNLLGYTKNQEALPTDMEQYYDLEEIKKYGVVGIELEK